MRRLRFLVIASLFVGCSLMTKYDLDGQPCDKNEPNPLLSCLSDAGFTCVNGFCTKGTATLDGGGFDGSFDASFDAGLDGGPKDGGADGGNLGG